MQISKTINHISASKYLLYNEPIEEVFVEHGIVVGEGLSQPRQPGGGDLLQCGLELEVSTKFRESSNVCFHFLFVIKNISNHLLANKIKTIKYESFYNIKKRPLLGHSLISLKKASSPNIVKTFAKIRCQLCLVGFVSDAAAVDDHSVVTLHYILSDIFVSARQIFILLQIYEYKNRLKRNNMRGIEVQILYTRYLLVVSLKQRLILCMKGPVHIKNQMQT